MSLKDQPEFSAKFEPMDTENVADAGVVAATAIAKAATTAVGAAKSKFSVAFADKNNVFDTATVEGLALSVPRVKGEQGSLFLGDKDLGSEIQVEIISFNHRWSIGDGADNAESKGNFRVSYDNETISGEGTPIQDYIEGLKAQGFSKTKKSPYMDIWAFITWTKATGSVGIDDRELVCLQCSQTSMGAFTAFATTRGLLESRGLAQPIEVIGVRAMKRVSGSNKYTNYEFFSPKAQ